MAPKSRGGGGSLSRRAAIALIGGGGLLGFSGTGAFTQVDSDRPFSASTAEDDNALLKLEGFDEDEAKEPHTITITNKFNEKVEGKIQIEGNSLEFESNTHSSIELEPGEEYEFDIVTPNDEQESGSSGSGVGSGSSGSGVGSGSSGNGPPCAGEVPGEAEGLPKCDGTDTIIFEFSGEENAIDAEREITVSHDPSEDTGTGSNTVLAAVKDPGEEVRDNTDDKLVFRVKNITSEQATVKQFAVSTSNINPQMKINDKNAEEVEIRRVTQIGNANRSNSFDADGTVYNFDTDAKINSNTTDAEVDIRRFSPAKLPNNLNWTDSASEANITVTLVLESGNKEYFYFKGS